VLLGDLMTQVAATGWRVCSVLILADGVQYHLCRRPGQLAAANEERRTVRSSTAVAALQRFLTEVADEGQ
jgi:hypothetical protein